MIMTRLDSAERLCRAAERQNPPIEDVFGILKGSVTSKVLERILINYGALYGRLGEVFVQEQLRMGAQEIPNPVEIVNIPSGTETKSYRFGKGVYGSTVVYDKATNREVTDIDCLVAIAEGIFPGIGSRRWYPFLVEVKMTRFGYLNESEELDRYWTDLTHVIKHPEDLNGINPVLELFHLLYKNREIDNQPKDVGLIVAMPRDQFNKALGGSQYRFMCRGGNILRFPTELAQYHQRICALVDRLRIV